MSEQPTLEFDAPPDDPVTAYLASGLTALNADQITIVELVSGLVAGFCSEAGVLVHQPVMHTHPTDHGDLSPAEVHDTDFLKVIDSDVVVAIGDYASWGAGKELAWAERLRTPVLVLLHHDRSVSRLVEGNQRRHRDRAVAIPRRYPRGLEHLFLAAKGTTGGSQETQEGKTQSLGAVTCGNSLCL